MLELRNAFEIANWLDDKNCRLIDLYKNDQTRSDLLGDLSISSKSNK